MIKVDAYKGYDGGKSGSGTYQTIINRVPPCDVLISGCLGNCGMGRHIRPAKLNIFNDRDPHVITSWKNAIQAWENYTLLNMDVVDLIRSVIAEKYDTAATFLYLDPPYLFETRKSKVPIYRFEMTTMDHQLLLGAALELKNVNIMFSAYPNAMYDEYLKGWHTHDFYSKIRNGMALERLYYNYDLTGLLHDYAFIGEDFREREKNTRIVNNMIAKVNRLEPNLRNRILQALNEQGYVLPATSQHSSMSPGFISTGP